MRDGTSKTENFKSFGIPYPLHDFFNTKFAYFPELTGSFTVCELLKLEWIGSMDFGVMEVKNSPKYQCLPLVAKLYIRTHNIFWRWKDRSRSFIIMPSFVWLGLCLPLRRPKMLSLPCLLFLLYCVLPFLFIFSPLLFLPSPSFFSFHGRWWGGYRHAASFAAAWQCLWFLVIIAGSCSLSHSLAAVQERLMAKVKTQLPEVVVLIKMIRS